MSIQILGGLARSFKLDVPEGFSTRPTSVMLRRRLFDARQSLIDYRFFDLCAGTGAVGFEAWSRGAKEVFLIEKEHKAFSVLKNNHQKLSQKYNEEVKLRPIRLVKDDFLTWLKNYLPKENDILFFDPPYEKHDLYLNFLVELKRFDYLCEAWIESDEQKGLSLAKLKEQNLPSFKNYVQGTSFVVIIKKS